MPATPRPPDIQIFVEFQQDRIFFELPIEQPLRIFEIYGYPFPGNFPMALYNNNTRLTVPYAAVCMMFCVVAAGSFRKDARENTIALHGGNYRAPVKTIFVQGDFPVLCTS